MKNLNKEYHAATKPSVDFIYKNLEDAFNSGLKYDVTDMRNAVWSFASHSTNNADYCIKLVGKMHFKSEAPPESVEDTNANLVFYDIEVFPNLLLINWKYAEDYTPDDFDTWKDYIYELQHNHKTITRMINPGKEAVEDLMRQKLVGFNCRRYDNHILYGRFLGYSNEEIFALSSDIINNRKGAFFGQSGINIGFRF